MSLTSTDGEYYTDAGTHEEAMNILRTLDIRDRLRNEPHSWYQTLKQSLATDVLLALSHFYLIRNYNPGNADRNFLMQDENHMEMIQIFDETDDNENGIWVTYDDLVILMLFSNQPAFQQKWNDVLAYFDALKQQRRGQPVEGEWDFGVDTLHTAMNCIGMVVTDALEELANRQPPTEDFIRYIRNAVQNIMPAVVLSLDDKEISNQARLTKIRLRRFHDIIANQAGLRPQDYALGIQAAFNTFVSEFFNDLDDDHNDTLPWVFSAMCKVCFFLLSYDPTYSNSASPLSPRGFRSPRSRPNPVNMRDCMESFRDSLQVICTYQLHLSIEDMIIRDTYQDLDNLFNRLGKTLQSTITLIQNRGIHTPKIIIDTITTLLSYIDACYEVYHEACVAWERVAQIQPSRLLE